MSNTALIHGPLPETNYLYKNVVVKGNFPLASLLVHPDTKYTIKHNFDLEGQTIELPPNCILAIDGGMIYNGTLVGDDSILIDVNRLGNVLDNVIQTGTWKKQDVLNSISIGTVISGDEPQVTITGEDGDTVLNFVLPKGDPGEQGILGLLGIQGEKGDKGDKGDTGSQGEQGPTGNGIQQILLNSDYTLTVTYTNGTTYTTSSIRGEQGIQGEQGVSVSSFLLTEERVTDTLYNIVFSDGNTQSISIPKGATGPTGETGPTGNGILNITLNGDYTLTINYTNGTSYTTSSIRGAQGDSGYSGNIEDLLIVNNLTEGGSTAALSAEMGKELSQSINIKYNNSQSGLSSNNVQGALDEVAIESAINENYCKSGVKTRFVQGIVSSSNGDITVNSDNITSVFIEGGCIVAVKDGYCIRRVAKYDKTTEAFISGLYASDDYTRQFIFLEDGYKYRFTVYAGGTNISTRDDVLESIKVYSFPYINSVDNPDDFESFIISQTGKFLTAEDNRTFIYRIAFEGQLFVCKYYLDGDYANRGIWIADDKNGTNITRKSTSATIGYHSDKYVTSKSDVGKYIFICGKHDPSSGYVLDVGYISNSVDNVYEELSKDINNVYEELSENINNVTVISKSVNVSDYIYNGWITYNSTLKWTSQSGGSCIVIPIKSVESVSVTAHNSNNSMYIWLKTCNPKNKELLDISTGSTLKSIIANTTETLTVPDDAEYIMILGTVDNVDRKPSSVILHNRLKDTFVLEQDTIQNGVVSDGRWIKTHAYLSNENKHFAVSTYTYSKYINVKAGDNFTITADKGYDCEWATLKSIPNLIVHMQASNSIRFGVIESGKSINLTINKDETILLLNLGNSQYTYDGAVMYSTNHWVSGGNPVICVPVYGQSLAVGGDAPRITNSAKFPLITFNTELLYNKFTDTQETAKFGLLDSYVESLCIDRRIGLGNVGSSIMSFSFGQGSRSITLLKKGTTLYTQFLAKILAAYDIVGSSLVVPAFCWIQGEDDRFGDYTDDYKGELLQLRTDLDADIKAITGQTQDVHCIVYQTNQLSIGSTKAGHFVPTSYNSGDYGGLMTVPTAQYELIRDNPYFHAATPIYYMKFAVSSNGRTIHINSESQKVMGFYCGLAAERVTEGLADIGLYVQSVTKVDSTHIQLTLHTPCPPIVVDTQQVYEVDGYGFSVITPNNTNILQSVEVKPNHWSEQVINITTSEDCTNAKVRYGCNGVIAGDSDGYARGSRGNIRDSQGLLYFATVNGKQIPMHNWLYFGEWLIS